MPLNSFPFLLLFLPIVAATTFFLRDRFGLKAAQGLVVFASVVFYAINSVSTLWVLIVSIVVNAMMSRVIARKETPAPVRRRGLAAAIVFNVLLLGLYKYLTPVWLAATGMLGQSVPLPLPELGFPLGLSFFTLTQIMYLVDCFEGLIEPKPLLEYAGFVAFFPNITAGPLLRARLYSAQARNVGLVADRNLRFTQASVLIAMGLCKKVILGDSFARLATTGYSGLGHLSTFEAWLTTLAGTFEVYFDFSGYSDMAFGSAGLLGLTLVRNFNVPYRAISISDFWRRWHISLSDFITTYLYTPLLRRMGKATVHTSAIATLVSMIIAGLWHGASWNFVLFGVLHGCALAGFQYWKRRKRPLPRAVAMIVTFLFVNVVFITVRATDVAQTLAMAAALLPRADLASLDFFSSRLSGLDVRQLALPLGIGGLVAFVGPTAEDVAARLKPSIRADLFMIGLLLAAYVYMGSSVVSEFRYRQF